MKIINAGFQILSNINGMEMLKAIEYIARTCYKSENSITELSAVKMVESLMGMRTYRFFAVCLVCGAEMPRTSRTMKQAAEAWNRRADNG